MNAATRNRSDQNVVHSHRNNNSKKNLAFIEPLEPPNTVECFHGLSRLILRITLYAA